MAMTTTTGFSAHDVVDRVFTELQKKLKGRKLSFKNRVQAEIGNDSDWHRTRIGYMGYDSVYLAKMNGKTWILGRGQACGAYPADPYDSDIFVLEVPENRQGKTIESMISHQEYFISSAFFATSDGQIAGNKDSDMAQKVLFPLQETWLNYIIEPTKYRDDVIGLDLRPIPSSQASFKPELVDLLTEKIVNLIFSESGLINPRLEEEINKRLPKNLTPSGGEFTPEGDKRAAELFARIDAGEVSE